MDQPPPSVSAVYPVQVRSDSSSKQPRRSTSQHSLSHQQMQQLQDIKPALLPNTTHRQRFTYKDKFQALRDKYEQVSAVRALPFLPPHCSRSERVWQTNEALRKELSIAEEKMQKLEAENRYVD